MIKGSTTWVKVLTKKILLYGAQKSSFYTARLFNSNKKTVFLSAKSIDSTRKSSAFKNEKRESNFFSRGFEKYSALKITKTDKINHV